MEERERIDEFARGEALFIGARFLGQIRPALIIGRRELWAFCSVRRRASLQSLLCVVCRKSGWKR